MVDRFMEAYDKKQALELEAEKGRQQAEADDGWTLVVPKKQKKGTKRLRPKKDNPRPAKQPKLHPGLYRSISGKSSKAAEIELLRKKFAEDKEKIKRLRQQRRFQPTW